MKTLLKILVITFVLFGLEGCYTILWTPDKKITDDYNSSSCYYGYATDFYDIPWWITVPIIVDYPYNPTSGNVSLTKDRDNSRDGDTKDIRNNDGGRTTGGRIEILNTPPPTISTGDSNNTSTSSNSNTGSSGSVSRTESSSSSSSGSSNTRSSDTRNDSGSRNSGNERK